MEVTSPLKTPMEGVQPFVFGTGSRNFPARVRHADIWSGPHGGAVSGVCLSCGLEFNGKVGRTAAAAGTEVDLC